MVTSSVFLSARNFVKAVLFWDLRPSSFGTSKQCVNPTISSPQLFSTSCSRGKAPSVGISSTSLFYPSTYPPTVGLEDLGAKGTMSMVCFTSFFCRGQEHRAEHLSKRGKEKGTKKGRHSHRLYIKIVERHAIGGVGQVSALWKRAACDYTCRGIWKASGKTTGPPHVTSRSHSPELRARLSQITRD